MSNRVHGDGRGGNGGDVGDQSFSKGNVFLGGAFISDHHNDTNDSDEEFVVDDEDDEYEDDEFEDNEDMKNKDTFGDIDDSDEEFDFVTANLAGMELMKRDMARGVGIDKEHQLEEVQDYYRVLDEHDGVISSPPPSIQPSFVTADETGRPVVDQESNVMQFFLQQQQQQQQTQYHHHHQQQQQQQQTQYHQQIMPEMYAQETMPQQHISPVFSEEDSAFYRPTPPAPRPPRLRLLSIPAEDMDPDAPIHNTYQSSPFNGYPEYKFIFENAEHMRREEMNLIAKIQMKSLQMENPYLDDFYFCEIEQRRMRKLAPSTVLNMERALRDIINAKKLEREQKQKPASVGTPTPTEQRLFGRLPSVNLKGMRTIVELDPSELRHIKGSKSTLNFNGGVKVAGDIEKGMALLLQIKDTRVCLAVKPKIEPFEDHLRLLNTQMLRLLKLKKSSKSSAKPKPAYVAEICRRTKGIKFIRRCLRELTKPYLTTLVNHCEKHWDAISAAALSGPEQQALEQHEIAERNALLEELRQALAIAKQ